MELRDLTPYIRQLLLERSLVQEESAAERLLNKLLVYVLQLLSQPEIKRLEPTDLVTLATSPELTPVEHSILTNLKMALSQFNTLFEQLNTDPNYAVQLSVSRSSLENEVLTHLQTASVSPDLIPTLDESAFPDTPRRKAVMEGVGRLLNYGEKLTVSIDDINIPGPASATGMMREFVNAVGATSITIELLPGPYELAEKMGLSDEEDVVKVLNARVEFIGEDGATFLIDGARFELETRAFRRVVYSNEGQPQMVPLPMELRWEEGEGQSFYIEFQGLRLPLNVTTAERILKLQHIMSQRFASQLRLLDPKSGKEYLWELKQPKPIVPAPDPQYVELVESLVIVQHRIGTPIILPDRKWTPEEKSTAATLNMIVQHGGYLIQGWTLSTSCMPTWNSRVQVLNLVKGKRGIWFGIVEDAGMAQIFGVSIPLGKVRATFHGKVGNERDVLRWLYLPSQRGVPLKMHFVPGKGDTVYVQYPEWEAIQPLNLPEWFE